MTHSCQRIGHGGASALAPANTLAAFDAAVEVGVDMVEFDVRGCRDELVLGHTVLHARRATSVPLRAALAHLGSGRFGGIELNVDLKHPGCETALLDQLRHAGLLERTLISSQVPRVLDRIRARDTGVRVGISVGGRLARTSRRWRDWRVEVLGGLLQRRWDAVMAQHRLVDRELVAEVLERGGRTYAWTVNDRSAIRELRLLGIDGIVTADPRLFHLI